MKHEDEAPETINQQVKRMTAAAHCIEKGYNDVKKERDDAIAFLRSLQKMDMSAVVEAIGEYLDDYDVPF